MSTALSPRLAQLIRQDVQLMQGYAVQSSSGLVKLDAMENPHSLPPAMRTALGERLAGLSVNRYPGDQIEALKQTLASHVGLPEGHGLMLGNGSDELIALVAMAVAKPAAERGFASAPAVVLAPVPGFVMYAISAQQQGLDFVGVDLTADFELDQKAMLEAIAEHEPAIVYLAYPNNPTANLWDEAVIDKIIEAAPGIVVIDEAYQPFAGKSYLSRIQRHEHVLLMRTLSKFGLAGVRLGYMVGPAALVQEIDKLRPPYNVSVLNCETALFALENAPVFAQQAQEVCVERDRLVRELAQLPGVTVWPSAANMILMRVAPLPESGAAQRVFEGMKARGVLVKNVSKMHRLLANCLRITVGTAGENGQMLAALKASL